MDGWKIKKGREMMGELDDDCQNSMLYHSMDLFGVFLYLAGAPDDSIKKKREGA